MANAEAETIDFEPEDDVRPAPAIETAPRCSPTEARHRRRRRAVDSEMRRLMKPTAVCKPAIDSLEYVECSSSMAETAQEIVKNNGLSIGLNGLLLPNKTSLYLTAIEDADYKEDKIESTEGCSCTGVHEVAQEDDLQNSFGEYG